MSELNTLIFSQWKEQYEQVRAVVPPVGSMLSCEREGEKPKIIYIEKQNLLYFSAKLSDKILDGNNQIVRPYWVLVPDDGPIEGTMKVIVNDTSKALYLANKDKISLSSCKVVAHSRSGLSIISEIVF